jgi:hypothetical protein
MNPNGYERKRKMAAKKAAVKDLVDMSRNQKAMIRNIEEITDRVVSKVGGVKTAEARQEIVEAVAAKYLADTVAFAKRHLSMSTAQHRKIVNSVLYSVTKQFEGGVA